MAKQVAANWRMIDQATKAKFEALARQEKAQYRRKMAEFRQLTKPPKPAKSSNKPANKGGNSSRNNKAASSSSSVPSPTLKTQASPSTAMIVVPEAAAVRQCDVNDVRSSSFTSGIQETTAPPPGLIRNATLLPQEAQEDHEPEERQHEDECLVQAAAQEAAWWSPSPSFLLSDQLGNHHNRCLAESSNSQHHNAMLTTTTAAGAPSNLTMPPTTSNDPHYYVGCDCHDACCVTSSSFPPLLVRPLAPNVHTSTIVSAEQELTDCSIQTLVDQLDSESLDLFLGIFLNNK